MTNPADYAYYFAKLAGEDPDPLEPRTTVPSGFWRLRDGKPLATWRTNGLVYGLIGFDQGDIGTSTMEAMAESGAFKAAVTEEFYREAIEKGYWPDSEGPARQLAADLARYAEALTEVAVDGIVLKLSLYPHYRLTKKQRKEIDAALKALRKAAETYDRTVAAEQKDQAA